MKTITIKDKKNKLFSINLDFTNTGVHIEDTAYTIFVRKKLIRKLGQLLIDYDDWLKIKGCQHVPHTDGVCDRCGFHKLEINRLNKQFGV